MASNYITVQGDTWDSIAYRLWGEERHMHLLVQANVSYADVAVFPADMQIIVPDTPSKRADLDLPPWMQGGAS